MKAGFLSLDNSGGDALSPLGSPIVLQRKGSVYGANVPMITELVNDSNVQFLDQVCIILSSIKAKVFTRIIQGFTRITRS